MFTSTKTINGRKYKYLEHTFRIGSKVKKVSFYIGKDLQGFNLINKKSIKKIVDLRVNYITKQHSSKFFTYGIQIRNLEEQRTQFQILSRIIPKKEKQKIMDEFLRTFIVNSMAMEGGTISYEIAKAIDEKKKIRTKNINELDIPLYIQLKKAYKKLIKSQLRYPKQIRDLHKTIYKGIYPFAGKFREKNVTFGDLNKLAQTTDFKKIGKGYQQALKRFYRAKGRIYDFERVVRLHADIQEVHGFEDGNSRLARLIMIYQLLQLGYSPFLVKAKQSKAYRRALVRAINDNDNTSLLKFFYSNSRNTFLRFWLPVFEEKIKSNSENYK